ncbi:MAG TPA: activator of (R)-2-hydroxyglutaryl-CoA dehydratase [Blastocatellia bacterium]|nr:activator of (R)-2-hydroxyglutaryl-CoA dehydratase [Blastocatellia bacterium]
MSTNPNDNSAAKTPISLVNITSKEEVIRQKVEQERARLAREMGIDAQVRQHFMKPVENPFTRSQREHTTLLFGGLTWKHEYLIHGALEGLGYKCESVPTPNVQAFQLGKEYGNNGQCNPTYFTVGNLVQHLQSLEEKGMSRQEIIDKYVFFTAGACGPCRFGMYEAEYRLALRNSGFDGFRVMLFQQSGGLDQSEAEAGLDMNVDFFLAILNAMNMGDMVTDVGYQVRPFEVEKGEADAAIGECMDFLHEIFKTHRKFTLEGKVGSFVKNLPKVGGTAEYMGKFIDQLYGTDYTDALKAVGDRLGKVKVDRTRVKPIVKITGEFWAQTTEGDGNFNMFRFLEREGAQVLVEPIGTWIMYMIHQAKQSKHDRKGVTKEEAMPSAWRLDKRIKNEVQMRKATAKLTLAEGIFRREWNRLREALNGIPHDLTDQYELQRMGHPFYNSRAGGGEGHLEVAKNIYYSNKDLAHMVLSLKPFGCMPSTQSDGAQSAVVNLYKEMIYLPVETSGEGEINAHSRVQMALGEAKVKAKQEMARVLEETGLTLDQVREYQDAHPELQSALYKVPHHKGVIGSAANFVKHVSELMKKEGRAGASNYAAD